MFHEILFFDAVIAEATELLELERKQIVEAWNECELNTDQYGFISTTPENYYNSKYLGICE